MAEYLGARYLVKQIRGGLPIGRVIALLTGADGGVPSDLRGLFAWLACLCPEHSALLLRRDPLGIILYGDAAILPVTEKLRLLKELTALSERDPWFREGDWASVPFGALACPELAEPFREILEDKDRSSHLMGCVLDALVHGTATPQLREQLLAIVRDPERHSFLRRDALAAYRHACPDEEESLRRLLDDIHEGHLSDSQNGLRDWLLEALFPRTLGLREVLPYIVPGNERFFGPYASFLRRGFLDRLDDTLLADFLNILSEDSRPFVPSNIRVRRLIGEAVLRGLELLKDRVPVERLYRWLGAQLNESGFSFDWERKKHLMGWLENHPEVVRDLFLHWLSVTPPDNLLEKRHYFWDHRCPVSNTPDLRRWLLTLVDRQQDPRVAAFLVRDVARWILRQDQNLPTQEEVSEFEDLARFVEQRSHLSPSYLEEIVRPVDESWLRHVRMKQEGRRQWEERRQANLQSLRTRMEETRRGIDAEALEFLAGIYFDTTEEFGERVEPQFRIERYLGPEIAAAAHSGFIAALCSLGEPKASDIGRARSQNRYFCINEAVLAGVEILWAQSQQEILTLPRECLGRALVFLLDLGYSLNRDWSLAVIAKVPSVAAESLESYWRALLDHNHEDM